MVVPDQYQVAVFHFNRDCPGAPYIGTDYLRCERLRNGRFRALALTRVGASTGGCPGQAEEGPAGQVELEGMAR